MGLSNKIDRRAFLKLGGALAAGSLITPTQMLLASSGRKSEGQKQYAMVVDVSKCDGCNTKECELACREENNVPLYGNPKLDAYWLRVAKVDQDLSAGDKNVPLMCQHCDNAPCVHVCPVGASFKRKDGIVLVDEHRCIGCRYCMIACPYKARSFTMEHSDYHPNPKVPRMMHGVATKCNFCVQRVDKNEDPACVVKCKRGALKFGNMNDPNSEVGRIIAEGNVKTLRPNLEVGPKVFYLGL